MLLVVEFCGMGTISEQKGSEGNGQIDLTMKKLGFRSHTGTPMNSGGMGGFSATEGFIKEMLQAGMLYCCKMLAINAMGHTQP